MTDWDLDPELRALRDEFAQSFARRIQALEPQLHALRAEGAKSLSADEGCAYQVKLIAHNLAGSASTYGFNELGQAAAELDDLLSEGKSVPVPEILRLAERLHRELTSYAGSPASAARRGSF